MKISFYFTTQNEYNQVKDLVKGLNAGITNSYRWTPNGVLSVTSKHVETSGRFNTNIPKSRSSDKKYIGVIRGNKHVLDKAEIDIYGLLKEIDAYLVPKLPEIPKYDGEISSCKFALTGFTQFRTLSSVFNARFGHGNWRVNGPKKLQRILKNYEKRADRNVVTIGNAPDFYGKKYTDGVEVTIIVNEPDANIEKHLFKVKLKA